MSDTNETLSTNESWPVPVTIKSALSDGFKPWMRGHVLELTDRLKASVIFVYAKNTNEKLSISDIEIISDRRGYEMLASPACSALSVIVENKSGIKHPLCEKNDKNALISFINSRNENKILENWACPPAYDEVVYYTYVCSIMKFEEWFIPVELNGVCVGAFITGQFKVDSESKADIATLQTAMMDVDIQNEKLQPLCDIIKGADMHEYALQERTKEEMDEFFGEVKRIIVSIEKQYNKQNEIIRAQIANRISTVISGSVNRYSGAPNIKMEKFQNIYDSFLRVRTDFCDAMILFRDAFRLKRLVLFKPRKYPHKDQISGVIASADLTSEVIPDIKGSQELSREFQPTPYAVSVEAAKRDINSLEIRENARRLHVCKYTKKKDILNLITPVNIDGKAGHLPNDDELENAALILCFMDDNEDSLVGCLVQLENVEITESILHALSSTFSDLSAIFLARRSASLSAYHQRAAEANNNYLKHELGQEIAGMKAENDVMQSRYAKAICFNPKDILNAYPDLPEPVSQFLTYIESRYAKNIFNFTESVDAIISRVNIFDSETKLDKRYVYPYGDILYRLVNSNTQLTEEKHQEAIILRSIDQNDQANPSIKVDPAQLGHAINNLLRNAIKYGHIFSKVHVETKLTEQNGKKTYNFYIKNYGTTIPVEDQREIFTLGFRASNATDENGIGFGLFIARQIAQRHGGDVELVECEEISSKNIPLLEFYINSSAYYADEKSKKFCEDELNRIRETGEYEEIVATYDRNLVGNPFSPVYFLRNIDKPTARIIFRLSIPYHGR